MPSSTRSSSTKRQALAQWLERQWYRLGVWHVLLLPLSWLFSLLAAGRRLAYRTELLKRHRAAVPVIVVGNISVGGTGKTPLVIWLVMQLRRAGYTPGIISRGYGGSCRGSHAVTADADPRQFGDEPVLLARRTGCPVWVGRDRVASQQALLRAHPACDVIVSDDGLQHYRLRRDVELVVVDAERKFGNGYLMPAGPLREPISRLQQVDAVVYHGRIETDSAFVMTLASGEIRSVLDAEHTVTVAALAAHQIHAVAGIGHPQRFFQQLAAMGLRVTPHAFADHHQFQPSDFRGLQGATVLMTEKDAVKCRAFAQPGWWYLPVDAVVDGALADYIVQCVKKSRSGSKHG